MTPGTPITQRPTWLSKLPQHSLIESVIEFTDRALYLQEREVAGESEAEQARRLR